LKPAVLAVVAEAVFRIGKRALRNSLTLALAAGAFIGIFFFDIRFPWIIAFAVLAGVVGARLGVGALDDSLRTDDDASESTGRRERIGPSSRPSLTRSAFVAFVFLTLWFGPLLILVPAIGWENVFIDEWLFFSKTAVFTFGGAYAVLSYIAQEAVNTFGWLAPGEMLDGLGMAETTPGPLIQVVQFVAFLGAFRDPGSLDPMTAGILGSIVATWVTFVPCFLWIFLGAPYIEHLRGIRALDAALSAVTAAVVGVILNLAVWFSLHTLFAEVASEEIGPLRLLVPAWGSIDPVAACIAIAAFYALFRLRFGMLRTLGLSALVGAAYHLLAI
jgi:chromate transporter